MADKLPELPKKYNRREAVLDGRVARWFEKHHPHSVLLEVKMKGGRLTEHQRKLMEQTGKTGKFKYKFPDGGKRTPLDYIICKDIDTALATCTKDGNCECIINNNHRYKFNIKV